MTSRLRQLTDRAERVQRERKALRVTIEGIRQREILDLQTETEGIEAIINAARSIHYGDDEAETWLARIGASLAATETRWEAGERARLDLT